MLRASWTFILGLMMIPASVSAQDVPSGPDKGKSVPALKVFDATGLHEGKEVNYSADRKDKPTIYLFVHAEKWDRPIARFIRKLDEAVTRDAEDAYVVAVWVGGESEKLKEHLPAVQKSLQLQSTALTVFAGEQTGPDGWNINSDAHLTAVVTSKAKVAVLFGYRSTNETAVPAVFDALKKGIGGK